jgi:hypothetical protein
MKMDKTELTDREKFIHHYVTLQTLRVMCKRFSEYEQIDPKDLRDIATVDPQKDVEMIRKTRCRRLTDENISEIMEGLTQEALLGGNIINDMID